MDNFFRYSVPIIAKKGRVFKDFSGLLFFGKMQVIHNPAADPGKVIHNILWSVGNFGTSFPRSMRLFLHFRVKLCGIAHSGFSGKFLPEVFCAGNGAACGEPERKKRPVRYGSGRMVVMNVQGNEAVMRSGARFFRE